MWRSDLASLISELIDRSEGNPFFLEEIVRHLADTGVLAGERGNYRLARPHDPMQVPATVQAVLAARIDRLAPPDKNLLQAASAIGRRISMPLLQAVAGVPEPELKAGLRRLQEAGFLHEARALPEVEYAFAHALMLDVAYGGLLQARRHALDARIVGALERLNQDRLGDQIERLAHHARRGELWDKAAVYCREAGNRAFVRSAHHAAVARFEEALEALRRLPASRANDELAIDIRIELRSALTPIGEFGRMMKHLQEAEAIARALEDQRRLGLIDAFLTNSYTVMVDFERAIGYGENALRIAERTQDRHLEVVTTAYLGMAHYGFGENTRAAELGRRNVALLQGDQERDRFGMALFPAVYARTVLAFSLAECGRFEEGAARAREAIGLAETLNHAHSLVFACLGLGQLLHRKGDFPEAAAVLKRALDICQSANVTVVMPSVVGPLASSLARSGRADEALQLLEIAVKRALAMGDPYGRLLRSGGTAEAYLCAGRAQEALPLARQAVEGVRLVKARGTETHALLLLGEICAACEPESAEAPFREALALATRLDMQPAIARCHLGLAEVARLLGRPEEATAARAVASEMFRTLGMKTYLVRCEASA